MTDLTEIVAVEACNEVLPLPQPLTLGQMTVHRREYTAVRVRTADGLVGRSYCLSREAPMAEVVHRLIRPHMVGKQSNDVASLWDGAFRGSAIVGRVGLVRRALGLVDIALWDIAAKREGVPVWALLGSGNDPRDCMIVASYPTPDRSGPEIVDEVLGHAEDGWPLLKIAYSPDKDLMAEVLDELGSALPEAQAVVVDAGFGWRNSDDALIDLTAWGHPPLAWLEDPVLPEAVDHCARIRSEGQVRVGVGDEVTDPMLFEQLTAANALDVARVDVVAIGGITPAMKLISTCRDAGLELSSHVCPEVSIHLGIGVETFDRSPNGNPYDPAPTLIRGGPSFEGGVAIPSNEPGLGFGFAEGLFEEQS